MKKIDNNSIDLIFADPPYYLQLPKKKRLKRANGTEIIPVDSDWDKFDSYEDYDGFTNQWISECQRVVKPSGSIWVMGMYHNIFRVGTIMQNLGLWFLNDIIWVKTDALPNLNGRRFTNSHETLIWAVKNKECTSYFFNYELMKKMNGGKQMKDTDWIFGLCRGKERIKDENGIKIHPTQKPLKLIQQVLLASSKKGDLVLDPFFGTGTTGVVAKALERDWIGIEKEKKYVDIANKRISEYKRY
ncbi:MAG: DNA-methyltransferase [Campylobacterales bacterium]